MKKNTKRVLACIAAVAMSCTMVTGLAANTATIESITVYDTDSTGAKTGAGTVIDITEANAGSLNPSQIAEVKVVIAGDSPAAAEATFLSFIKGQEAALSNTTIQYVDQKTVTESTTEGETPVTTYTATFTFRPRTTIGANANGYANFVAKAGGSDVATAAVGYYNVVAAPINISMTVSDNEVQLGTQDTATYTLTGLTAVPETSTLTINNAAVDAANYAVTVAEGVYTLTINPAAYAALAAGTYDVTFTAPGYTTANAQIIVAEAAVEEEEDIPEENVDDAKDAISAVEGAVSGSTATFTEKVTVGGEEKTVKYTVKDADASKVDVVGNTITLKNNLFAAKVTVTAAVGGADQGIETEKTVYIIPDMSKVSYGNFELVSDSQGNCAFDDNTSFAAAINDTIANNTKAEALAFVLGKKSEADKAPHFTQTLDYDHDGSIALAEYRILKLMLDNNLDNFKPEKLAIDRAAWLEAHPNN